MLLASWEVRKVRPEVAVSHYTGLTLSPQITYLFFSPLSKISFLILCLQTRPLCKCSKLTDVVKRNFFIFVNIVIKIGFEKKVFVFQFSCQIKSSFEKSFCP